MIDPLLGVIAMNAARANAALAKAEHDTKVVREALDAIHDALDFDPDFEGPHLDDPRINDLNTEPSVSEGAPF